MAPSVKFRIFFIYKSKITFLVTETKNRKIIGSKLGFCQLSVDCSDGFPQKWIQSEKTAFENLLLVTFSKLCHIWSWCVNLERSYQVDKGFSETKWRLTRFEEKRKVRHSVIYFFQKCYFGPQAADLNLEQTWPGSDEDFFVVSRPTRRSESREQPPILVW